MEFELLFLKMPPKNIVAIKFILEGHEGLGVLRTLNSATGEVVIIALPDTIDIIKAVLANLKSDYDFRYIPAPSSLAGDWLLHEFFSR